MPHAIFQYHLLIGCTLFTAPIDAHN